jgi:hypothetical protein
MNTHAHATEGHLTDYEKIKTRFKNYLALNFEVDQLGYYATSFGNFLFEDYPELFTNEKLDETTELIKARAGQAVAEGRLDYSGFEFSKFQKIVERLGFSFIRDFLEEEADAIFTREQRYHIKRQALYLLVKVPSIEEIFERYGFYYFTDYCYGDEKEKKLDRELDMKIQEIFDKIS